MVHVIEIWGRNLEPEFNKIEFVGKSSNAPFIAFDVEFPGFLRLTPRNATPEHRYADMKHSVDNLKPIQLGITFCDIVGRPWPMTWQINLSDFDPAVDTHGEASLAIIRRSGLDLNRNHRDGSPGHLVGSLLRSKLLGCSTGRKGCVTFHGLYDFGYILKLLGITPLPETLHDFLRMVRDVLGPFYDLKYMARFCGDERLMGEVGLLKMSRILGVEFQGKAHQAGHDSFLTASVFYKLKYEYNIHEYEFQGTLYGLEVHEGGEDDYAFVSWFCEPSPNPYFYISLYG